MPELLRHLANLADIRGAAEAPDLRAAVPILNRLDPTAIADLLRRIRNHPSDQLYGLAPSVITRLREVATAGEPAVLDAALARIPVLLRRLLHLRVLTHDQAVMLIRDLGVATLPDLEAALAAGKIS